MVMTVKQASEKWGISDRRIRVLCAKGEIPGAYQEGRGWKIPIERGGTGTLQSTTHHLKEVGFRLL